MIRLYHVDKAYDRDTLALSDITLQVERGEFCFLTGGSGAGKTTLLRLLFREERSTRGDILVSGKNINVLPVSRIPEFRRSIGVVFQDFKLLKERTVLENVSFVLRLRGWGRTERQARAVEVLKAVGLAHRLSHDPRDWSRGQQPRGASPRALPEQPALLPPATARPGTAHASPGRRLPPAPGARHGATAKSSGGPRSSVELGRLVDRPGVRRQPLDAALSFRAGRLRQRPRPVRNGPTAGA